MRNHTHSRPPPGIRPRSAARRKERCERRTGAQAVARQRPFRQLVAITLSILSAGLIGLGCDSDNDDQMRPDLVAPAAVSDLQVEAAGTSWMTLAWTAPGDDGDEGRATTYDLRYRTTPFTAAAWDSLIQVADEPTPQTAGTTERMTLHDLAPATPYFFALLTYDETHNPAPISNVAADTTERGNWVVDPAGGGDFVTIGAALDAAADGDTIAIVAGTYVEPLSIEDLSVVLIGAGPQETQIRYGDSPEESEPVIRVHNGGLTLRNVRVTQPQIACGTGIEADSSQVEIEDCALIWCGLTARECDVVLRGTTLYGIPETRCDLIIQVLRLLGGSAHIERNILAGHPDGVLCGQGAAVTFQCNDCWSTRAYTGCPDPTGTDGNIAADPRFIDDDGEDFHLAGDSPCLAGATPGCDRMGAFGAAVER
ncbi:MAG: fibronectin type III domain-containing protein [Candidatus Eisenbacteria sp.]|nr:fibronectin type III domain-containing protein [Candidatus Eisenbacteria bacterium]